MPRRDVSVRRCAALALAAIALISACSGSGSRRPTTPATLQIVSPAPNAVTGPNVDVKLALAHAKIVPATDLGGKIVGDRGHIHISVDGTLVSMAFQLDQPVTDLSPGVHTIQAEFVASDHLPFRNRVVAAVTFRVS